MLPTIPVDSYVVWDRGSYSSSEVKRFDLVVHTLPLDELGRSLGAKEDSKYIFRIVGLSGETVEIKNGQIYIDGQRLEEPFGKVASSDNYPPLKVPEGQFFLLGDNRPQSNDSRFWTPQTIERKRILGKVTKIL